jgi:hypothetical protein
MTGATTRKAVESFLYVSLTAATIDDEEPQLLNQEIDRRNGVSLEEVPAVITDGLTRSA